MKKIQILYALVHAIFWCGYVISSSYTAVYLEGVGYNSTLIGIVTGIGAVCSVGIQPLLAVLIDKVSFLNNINNLLILKVINIVMAIVIMMKLPGAYTIAVMFCVILMMDASAPSIISSIAMEYNNRGGNINYGFGRGVGSMFFACFSMVLGYIVKGSGYEILMTLYIAANIAVIGMILIFQSAEKKSLAQIAMQDDQAMDGQEGSEDGDSAGEKETFSAATLLKDYPFLLPFLVSTVFIFISHMIVNTFLINMVERVGGNSSHLGISLALGAAMELPVMSLFIYLEKKIPVQKLLVISTLFFTVKPFISFIAPNIPVFFVGQFIQFGGYALYTPAAVFFMNKALKDKDRNVGQALIGACSLGIGGTVGNIIGGVIIDRMGVGAMELAAVGFAAVSIIFMLICYKKYVTDERLKGVAL